MVDNDMPGAWPVWTPGARLAGFKKRNTIHCYKQNMKDLGLVVSEKKIFFMFSHDAPGVGPYGPQGHGWRIYKEDHCTLLLTKYESSGPCGFREEDFLCFFHCKSMGANDPRGGAIFDPRGMIGRIYIVMYDSYLLKDVHSVLVNFPREYAQESMMLYI